MPSGITLAVEQFGEQLITVPLVVIHGGPSWSHHYLNPGLRLVGEHRHVIAPDLRGCGHSSRDLPLTQYQPELAVQDMIDLIDVMGFEQVDLLGFSTGGQWAQLLVEKYPDLVRRLVLASTTLRRLRWRPRCMARVSATSCPAACDGRDRRRSAAHDCLGSQRRTASDLEPRSPRRVPRVPTRDNIQRGLAGTVRARSTPRPPSGGSRGRADRSWSTSTDPSRTSGHGISLGCRATTAHDSSHKTPIRPELLPSSSLY